MTIPQSLILLRFFLAPIILLLAFYWSRSASLIIVSLMYIGLITDILDGIIARKQNNSTEKLRRLDSQVDMFFWVSIGLSSYLLYPEIISNQLCYVIMVLIMEALCYVISFIKIWKRNLYSCFFIEDLGVNAIGCIHIHYWLRSGRTRFLHSSYYGVHISYRCNSNCTFASEMAT